MLELKAVDIPKFKDQTKDGYGPDDLEKILTALQRVVENMNAIVKELNK